MVRNRALWVSLVAVSCLAWAGARAQERQDEDLTRYASVLQPSEAVLSYEVEAQGIYLQVITSAWIGQPAFLPYPHEELLSDVLALRDAIEAPRLSGDPHLETLLTTLYTRLVQPGLDSLAQQGLLEGITTLVIIPTGPLWYVPFSALLMIDRPPIQVGRWFYRYPHLVEHYALAFLPSLQELFQPDEAQISARRSSAVMSFCPDGAVCPRVDRALVLLPGGEPVRTYEGPQATTEALEQELAEARYLILLVPNIYVLASPWLSSLILADAPYELWKVASAPAQGIELAVIPTHDAVSDWLLDLSRPVLQAPFTLAAAEKVLPRSLPVLPLDGSDTSIWFTAFRTGGVQNVLMTNWCPNLYAFQDLFHRLCSYRAAGHGWAEALAKAQRDLIQRGEFEHLWFWAPYRLLGGWR